MVLSTKMVHMFARMVADLTSKGRPQNGLIAITSNARLRLVFQDCISFLIEEHIPFSVDWSGSTITVGPARIFFRPMDGLKERVAGMELNSFEKDPDLYSWHSLNHTHLEAIQLARSRVR